MADFYLRAVAEKGHRTKVAAICYQRIERGRPADRLNILLSEEFGEKEILRKMKALGLFDGGDRFSPMGPDVGEDLTLLATCATHYGIVDLRGEELRRFVEGKAPAATSGGSTADEKDKKRAQALLTEKASRLVERVTREAEMFLRELQAKTDTSGSIVE